MDASIAVIAQAEVGGSAIAEAIDQAVDVAAAGAVDPFVFQLSIFVLAIFVGYYVVWSVTPALHTPLMSVTNAISSVIVVGALLAVGTEVVPLLAGEGEGGSPGLARVLGGVALAIVAINIVGGFMVTQRMLSLYKKKPKAGQS
jgi:NAD(P) transhydrogenase subunit alpha